MIGGPRPHQVMPLHFAADKGCLDEVRLLLEAGANKDVSAPHFGTKTSLRRDAARCHLEVVAALLEAGANKEVGNPLFVAAEKWSFAMRGAVTESRGHCVDQMTVHGDTPLMVGAAEGHLEIAQLLLACGARCDLANRAGHTAMDQAVLVGNVAMTRLLLRPFRRIVGSGSGWG